MDADKFSTLTREEDRIEFLKDFMQENQEEIAKLADFPILNRTIRAGLRALGPIGRGITSASGRLRRTVAQLIESPYVTVRGLQGEELSVPIESAVRCFDHRFHRSQRQAGVLIVLNSVFGV